MAAGHDAQLTSRCLALAEGVVTMVSPVLLALSLKKDKWKSEVHEPALSMETLTAVAGATLVTGVLPALACCASERFHPTSIFVGRPSAATRGFFAFISSACLLGIACLISHLSVVSDKWVFVVGFLSGTFLLVRAVSYMMPHDDQQILPEQNNPEELCGMVDKSHEFLSGVTGILFLALEGMALEGTGAYPGTTGSTTDQHALRLGTHMTISFVLCAVGVVLIFLEMVPPRDAAMVHRVLYFTDIVMFIGTAGLLLAVMITITAGKTKVGFLFLFFPFLIFIQLVYRMTINWWDTTTTNDERNNAARRQEAGSYPDPPNSGHDGDNQHRSSAGQEAKPAAAPMGLTKVTFTGFLFVSVKAISGGSPSEWSQWFLLGSAAAIASGVSWRILTHTQTQNKVKALVGGEAAADEAANVASFFTHLCVAVATVPFAVVAWTVVAAKDP